MKDQAEHIRIFSDILILDENYEIGHPNLQRQRGS
jgi:hypothetical protein